jgi:hypothetical protein
VNFEPKRRRCATANGKKTEKNQIKKKMKTKIITLAIAAIAWQTTSSFCGFYVAKADASLYNNRSQVILVRDGNKTIVTMSSDFKGEVKDFAMVIPVPAVLKREDIKVVENSLFKLLDDYSAPRLAEYYDENPCNPPVYYDMLLSANETSATKSTSTDSNRSEKNYNVKIEARYNVEEYEVLILSAKESSGLKDWLVDNGYKIPAKAEKVLEPYIKSNLKFFVVKVNLEKYKAYKKGGATELRPLQISFDSPKFMLPIRLGMANSTGEQDMLIYAFTKTGRAECVNYRTIKMQTDREIPLFIQSNFGMFYKDVFRKKYESEGKNALFLEYAWNVSPNWGGTFCDPCVGNPPMLNELLQAGVSWLGQQGGKNWSGATYGNVFFTRLHVRYSQPFFPQDLMFQETPNQEQFQCRYVIHHPATGDLSCSAAKEYKTNLRFRKRKELYELQALAGWRASKLWDYMGNSNFSPKVDDSYKTDEKQNGNEGTIIPEDSNDTGGPSGGLLVLLGVVVVSILLIPSGKTIPKTNT